MCEGISLRQGIERTTYWTNLYTVPVDNFELAALQRTSASPQWSAPGGFTIHCLGVEAAIVNLPLS